MTCQRRTARGIKEGRRGAKTTRGISLNLPGPHSMTVQSSSLVTPSSPVQQHPQHGGRVVRPKLSPRRNGRAQLRLRTPRRERRLLFWRPSEGPGHERGGHRRLPRRCGRRGSRSIGGRARGDRLCLIRSFFFFSSSPSSYLDILFSTHSDLLVACSINVLIGVGLLADPLAMADSGWAMGVAILLFCSFTTFCSSFFHSLPFPVPPSPSLHSHFTPLISSLTSILPPDSQTPPSSSPA